MKENYNKFLLFIENLEKLKKVEFYFFGIAFAIQLLYLSGYFFFVEGMYFPITDCLDSFPVKYKVLGESGAIFAPSLDTVTNIMGAPRLSYGSEFDIQLWLNYFFGTFYGMVIQEVIIRIVAFVGMYHLLLKYIIKNNKYVSFLVALTFSLLPFWQNGGLSVAGMPLLFFSFLNLLNEDSSIKDWLFIILFPFYSLFAIVGIFIIIALAIGWTINYCKTKKIELKYISGLFLITILYFGVEYRNIDFLLNHLFVSHREEFNVVYEFNDCLSIAINGFVFGQWHTASYHTFIILPLVLGILIYRVLFKKRKLDIGPTKNIICLSTGLIVLFFLAILEGFYDWKEVRFLKEEIPLLNSVQFKRFYMFYAISWYLLFGIALDFLSKERFKYSTFLINFFIALQIFLLFRVSHSFITFREYLGGRNVVSFEEFYSTDLFDDIKSYIDEPLESFYVLNFGLEPAVAQYNGFNTAGGYLNVYPLAYKQKFRKIIEKELDNNNEIRKYFDTYGSRCYLFDDEIGKRSNLFMPNHYQTQALNLDYSIVKSMNIRYIFSAIEVKKLGTDLKFVKSFENDIWKIFIYQINI